MGAYDVGKLNLELEVRMISVCIQLGFKDQPDTDTLLCKVFHQDIHRIGMTKEDKESQVWQYNLR